jgi:hypothetical protein
MHKKGHFNYDSPVYFSAGLCTVFRRRWDALILHTLAHTSPALGYRHRVVVLSHADVSDVRAPPTLESK